MQPFTKQVDVGFILVQNVTCMKPNFTDFKLLYEHFTAFSKSIFK